MTDNEMDALLIELVQLSSRIEMIRDRIDELALADAEREENVAQ